MNTMRWPLALAALSALALLGACAPEGPGPVWFPLRTGEVQRYEVRYEAEPERASEVWTVRTQGPVQWEGESYVLRQHSEGVAFYLKADAQGVRRAAHQTELDREPLPDDKPQWVLKAPYTVGTEWSTLTVPYLLMRKNEYPRELKHSHKVQMNWRIEAAGAELTLRSGRKFSPCLHVVGEAFLNLYTDPVNGFTDVPLISHEWYCQGHGLLKFTREEKVSHGFMTGGRLSAEALP